MKKLVFIFVILVTPFAFTACTDDAADDVQPQVVSAREVESTEGEEDEDENSYFHGCQIGGNLCS